MQRVLLVAFVALLISSCMHGVNPAADTHEPAIMQEQKKSTQKQSSSTKTATSIEKRFTMNSDDSTLTFVGGSSLVSHKGGFERFKVTLMLDEADPDNLENADLDVVIDIASIKTDNPRLTQHLLKEDFFAASEYPEAQFESTSIMKLSEGQYTVQGDLTIKGITKRISMEIKMDDSVMSVHFALPRRVYGIGNDSYGDKLLDERVPVEAVVVFE